MRDRFEAHLWDDKQSNKLPANYAAARQRLSTYSTKHRERQKATGKRKKFRLPKHVKRKWVQLYYSPDPSSFTHQHHRNLAQNMTIQGRTPSILILDLEYLIMRQAYKSGLFRRGIESPRAIGVGCVVDYDFVMKCIASCCKYAKPKSIVGVINTCYMYDVSNTNMSNQYIDNVTHDRNLLEPVVSSYNENIPSDYSSDLLKLLDNMLQQVIRLLHDYDIPVYDAMGSCANYVNYLVTIHGTNRPVVVATNDVSVWTCSDPRHTNVSQLMFLNQDHPYSACPVTDTNVNLFLAARMQTNEVLTTEKVPHCNNFGLRYAYILLQRCLFSMPVNHTFFGTKWAFDYSSAFWKGKHTRLNPTPEETKTLSYAISQYHRQTYYLFSWKPDDYIALLYKGQTELTNHLRTKRDINLVSDVPLFMGFQSFIQSKLQHSDLNYRSPVRSHSIKNLTDAAYSPDRYRMIACLPSFISPMHPHYFKKLRKFLSTLPRIHVGVIFTGIGKLVEVWPNSHSGHAGSWLNRYAPDKLQSGMTWYWHKKYSKARATSRKLAATTFFREFGDYRSRNNVRYARAARSVEEHLNRTESTLDDYLQELLLIKPEKVLDTLGIGVGDKPKHTPDKIIEVFDVELQKEIDEILFNTGLSNKGI